ncbi:MAG: glycosyl transferase family 1 [Nitrosomonadales bacterium SCN 54-20]|nr:MAG: glycosyl transferase family 1 [Nitrosomonadales bacterium SCN 54-20]
MVCFPWKCNAMQNKPVVLLVAEAVTLAHFGRIATLAKALDSSVYQVAVASDPRYADLEPALGCKFYPIRSISSAQFIRALNRGRPLYSTATLIQYVEDDLMLLDSVKPNLVIGDFRLSLAVSAPLRKIPYTTVVNAYWSPFADIPYLVPDLPITRALGLSLAQKLFDIVRPIVFAQHARPLNRVRSRYGLPSLGPDLRNVYTGGDYTLYADAPQVIPIHNLPPNHYYLGPVLWSTHTPLPDWWDYLPRDKPIIFLTFGSSGQSNLLPLALEALSQLQATVMVATLGKIKIARVPANTYITEYLNVDIAIQHSQLAICNGGSLTVYQALAHGVPVIGLCSNMDQLLNMSAVERLGAGLALRAARVTQTQLKEAARDILETTAYAQAAAQVQKHLKQIDARERFRTFVARILDE